MNLASIFDMQNRFWSSITKLGAIGFLTLCTELLSIPVVTAVPALTALYYAIVKSVRRERSYGWKEYFRAFRQNFSAGMAVSFLSVFYMLITYLWYCMSVQMQGAAGQASFVIFGALALLYIAVMVWLVPVLSRYSCSVAMAVKFSMFLSCRYILKTAALIALLVLCCQCVLILPVLLILVPGLYMLTASFLVEKTLIKYTNKSTEIDGAEIDTWYLE